MSDNRMMNSPELHDRSAVVKSFLGPSHYGLDVLNAADRKASGSLVSIHAERRGGGQAEGLPHAAPDHINGANAACAALNE